MPRSRLVLVRLLALVMLSAGCRSPADTPTPAVPSPAADRAPFEPVGTAAPTEPDLAAAVMAATQPRRYGEYPSPDDRWRVEVTIYDCVAVGEGDRMAYETLELVETAGGMAETVDDQLISCGGLGAFGLAGLYWSPNSRFFYYTDAREGAPDGCGYWDRPVVRLDATDKTLVRLGGGPLSPDGTRLATWQGDELAVWDLDEGELGRVAPAIPGLGAGSLGWSPDGQALVYLLLTQDCPPSGSSYLVKLDLPGWEQRVLLESDAPIMTGLNWERPEQVRLFDADSQTWLFDLVAGALSPAP